MSFAAKRKKKKKSSNRIQDKQVPHTLLQKLSPKSLTSPLRPLKVAPSVSWAPIMATARRRPAPSSPKASGIRCPSILWALFLPTATTSSWLSLWIVFPSTPSSSLPVTKPQLQSVKPSCAMSSPTLAPPEDFSPTAAGSSLAPFGPSSYVPSGFSKFSPHLNILGAMQSTRGATAA